MTSKVPKQSPASLRALNLYSLQASPLCGICLSGLDSQYTTFTFSIRALPNEMHSQTEILIEQFIKKQVQF